MVADPLNGVTRFDGSTVVHRRWWKDWACVRCQAFGALPFTLTGGGLRGGKWQPNLTTEQFLKLAWYAHRNYNGNPFDPHGTKDGNLCLWREDMEHLRLGFGWRKERVGDGERLVLLILPGQEPPANYVWPPWRS